MKLLIKRINFFLLIEIINIFELVSLPFYYLKFKKKLYNYIVKNFETELRII